MWPTVNCFASEERIAKPIKQVNENEGRFASSSSPSSVWSDPADQYRGRLGWQLFGTLYGEDRDCFAGGARDPPNVLLHLLPTSVTSVFSGESVVERAVSQLTVGSMSHMVMSSGCGGI